jgi:hypothetical protein
LIVLSPGAEGEDVQVAQHFFEENARITALVCSPRFASDSTVYVALRQGLYRSTDGGTQWDAIPVPERMPPIVSMELDMALNSALNSVLNSAATMTVVVIGGDVLRVRLPD